MTAAARPGQVLELAQWAARAYGDYDTAAVSAIVTAVADSGNASAERLAKAAVAETEMGVVEDKVVTHQACSRGIVDHYRSDDFVSPRIAAARTLVEVPRPAGVVLSITPATDPVAAVYFTVLLSLITRNAVVVAPDQRAKHCSAEAARVLAEAAVSAGAPDGIVQVIDEPSAPVIEALRSDDRTDVVVGAGTDQRPANVPVFVDDSADIEAAARHIVDIKAFDNSLLPDGGSILIATQGVAERLQEALTRNGACVLDSDDVRRLREFAQQSGHLTDTDVVGRDAAWIASHVGLRVSPGARILLVPFERVADEEVLAHGALSPVLGMTTVSDTERALRAARTAVRIGGPEHSATIYSRNPAVITKFGISAAVPRLYVNPVDRPSYGGGLRPHHLMNWTRIESSGDSCVSMQELAETAPWRSPVGAVPAYPRPSNQYDGSVDF